MHFSTVDVLISAFLFINSVHASPLKSRQNDVTACLDSHNVTYSIEGSSNWTALTTPYNRRLVYVPAVVTIPTTPEDVSWSVQCAAASSLKVQAKGGGHSYASYSSGGQNGSLIIEMENFNSVTVNQGKSLLRVEISVLIRLRHFRCNDWIRTASWKCSNRSLQSRWSCSPSRHLRWGRHCRPRSPRRLWICFSKMGHNSRPYHRSRCYSCKRYSNLRRQRYLSRYLLRHARSRRQFRDRNLLLYGNRRSSFFSCVFHCWACKFPVGCRCRYSRI